MTKIYAGERLQNIELRVNRALQRRQPRDCNVRNYHHSRVLSVYHAHTNCLRRTAICPNERHTSREYDYSILRRAQKNANAQFTAVYAYVCLFRTPYF